MTKGMGCSFRVNSESSQVKISPESGAFQRAARQNTYWQFSGNRAFEDLQTCSDPEPARLLVSIATRVVKLLVFKTMWSWGERDGNSVS